MTNTKQSLTDQQREEITRLRHRDFEHYKYVQDTLIECIQGLMVCYSPNERSYDEVDDELKACLKQLTTSSILISLRAAKAGFNLPLF